MTLVYIFDRCPLPPPPSTHSQGCCRPRHSSRIPVDHLSHSPLLLPPLITDSDRQQRMRRSIQQGMIAFPNVTILQFTNVIRGSSSVPSNVACQIGRRDPLAQGIRWWINSLRVESSGATEQRSQLLLRGKWLSPIRPSSHPPSWGDTTSWIVHSISRVPIVTYVRLSNSSPNPTPHPIDSQSPPHRELSIRCPAVWSPFSSFIGRRVSDS